MFEICFQYPCSSSSHTITTQHTYTNRPYCSSLSGDEHMKGGWINSFCPMRGSDEALLLPIFTLKKNLDSITLLALKNTWTAPHADTHETINFNKSFKTQTQLETVLNTGLSFYFSLFYSFSSHFIQFIVLNVFNEYFCVGIVVVFLPLWGIMQRWCASAQF